MQYNACEPKLGSRMNLPLQSKDRPAELTPPENQESEFLIFVGRRVREIRARRGMTRKQLAHESGVSERHLAQVELGEGNVSITFLCKITKTLSVSLAELFSPLADEPAQKLLIQNLLAQIPADRLTDLVQRLEQEFGAGESARRTRIALIGLRGAGKSTLGMKLAGEMKIPFIELDREIERDAGIPLAEILSLYGQSGYRRIERTALEQVVRERDVAIISVSGGIVSEKESYEYLLTHYFTVWIKARPEEHMARVIAQSDFRPMAENDEAMEDLRRILAARQPLYRRADICLDTSNKSVEESFATLKSALQSKLGTMILKVGSAKSKPGTSKAE